MIGLNYKQARSGIKKRKIIFLLLFLGVLALVFYIFIVSPRQQWQLIIEAPKHEEVIYAIPVVEGDVFQLSYQHSVSKQEVSGEFKITDLGRIKPLATIFDSYGPGLPDSDEAVRVELDNGSFVVYHEEKPRQDIGLFVAPLTKDRLYIHDQEYDLTYYSSEPILLKIFVSLP